MEFWSESISTCYLGLCCIDAGYGGYYESMQQDSEDMRACDITRIVCWTEEVAHILWSGKAHTAEMLD